MRVFALSDVHVDYDVNRAWIAGLSTADYQYDVLVLAGDITHSQRRFEWCLATLVRRFRNVLFVPGNHDLWVIQEDSGRDSLQKFEDLSRAVEANGASMAPLRIPGATIVPLLSWYDYSFGEPSDDLRSMWMDYHACRWPEGYTEREVATHFFDRNDSRDYEPDGMVITCSHFVPRLDVMPGYVAGQQRPLYPVLGSTRIDEQLRQLHSRMHIYGHSHVNRRVTCDDVLYVNNAFGYPHETRITAKRLLCVHEC